MSRRVASILFSVGLLAVTIPATAQPNPVSIPDGAEWLLIGFRDPSTLPAQGDLLFGGVVRRTTPQIGAVSVAVPDLAQAYRVASADPRVRYVEFDGPAFARPGFDPNDPHFNWHHGVIGVEPAWDATRGSPLVRVAVIDSGLNRTHEDFAGQTRFRDVYDYIEMKNETEDDCGHGTAVTGALSAPMNNGIGTAGIAQTEVLILRALGETCFGSHESVGMSMVRATQEGADIMSISIYTNIASPYLRDVINWTTSRGSLIVAIAGNKGPCTDCVVYPWPTNPRKSSSSAEPTTTTSTGRRRARDPRSTSRPRPK